MARKKAARKPLRQLTSVGGDDPLWFKDAIIYQLHVRSFCDASGDGIGDFRGLTEKLDYIRDLGVTAIWLLPFFNSPLRDDGYDIADYTRINPIYGNLRDFKAFLREAHARELRVITELVLNHTSDQHEWFQKSRRAEPGDKWRDFYVWSDNDERYSDARIIFQDFETSNWTWDPVGGAYFWHRFYHHQPDLNFENPAVHDAMFSVIDFWLDLGVDGMRLDAVPYLYEREGTNCENLPQTHDFLKKLRRHVDEVFPGRMLLAEANQWPEDAAAYFGDGDECHMNFHFPLMPRLFMAIEREDRFPIIDILDQTPEIPDNAQWGIFLRNHDELTLEMVTDEERDYMYRVYANDPRARVNLGIRRRLAPLLRDNRRKMELVNALLLTLPGTPIIYYGDELRMGDNIYLGDRDGVRTPMQWSEDRNAGFSRANPQQLFLPVIIDAAYHYASRNVEVEQSQPDSMLWWMRRVIGLRKTCSSCGRGDIEFLTPENPKVLAYLRRDENETILLVANLSRYAQSAELDLSEFRGQTPLEMFGKSRFPPIGELPYFLTLGPFAFYWFRLEWAAAGDVEQPVELPSCKIGEQWNDLFTGKWQRCLQKALPLYLERHRWFEGMPPSIQRTTLLDVLEVHDVPKIREGMKHAGRLITEGLPPMRLLVVRVEFVDDDPRNLLLPVVFARGEQSRSILGDHPGAGIMTIERAGDGIATLCDASREPELWLLLYDALIRRRVVPGRHGHVEAEQTKALSALGKDISLEAVVHVEDQRNTTVVLGRRFIFKLFRSLQDGENPDFEIGRHLTVQSRLSCVPQTAGALTYVDEGGKRSTLAVMHEYIANQGDAWTHTLDELQRYVERVTSELSGPPSDEALARGVPVLELIDAHLPEPVRELIGPYLQTASLLGIRTAELHRALSADTNDAFSPEPFTQLYQRSLYQSMRAPAKRLLNRLRRRQSQLPDAAALMAPDLLHQEESLQRCFEMLKERPIQAQRTRCHGDFNLRQVLFTGKDFVLIDFEGDPERPLSERRIKTSPLKDVASMLNSLHYATHAVTSGPQRDGLTPAEAQDGIKPWLQVWYVWSAAAFLQSYLAEAAPCGFLPDDRDNLSVLLRAYQLDKAVSELGYEYAHRPDWMTIPMEAILQLLAPGSRSPASPV